jgi:hypothetical protein
LGDATGDALRHVLQDQRACYAGRRYNRAHTAALLVCKV